jgi:hypothetical protein
VSPLVSPVTETVTVGAAESAAPLRIALKAGSFAETVVVTAHRAETRLAEIPQKIEIVDAIDRSLPM